MRIAVPCLVAALALAAGCPAPAATPDEIRRIDAFITRVYRPYLGDPPKKDDPDRKTVDWNRRGLLGREFKRLVDLDSKLAHGEAGLIEADPICACQDWGYFHYRIVNRMKRGRHWYVTIDIRNWGERHELTLILVPRSNNSFVIDDLADDLYRPSFTTWMAKNMPNAPEYDFSVKASPKRR